MTLKRLSLLFWVPLKCTIWDQILIFSTLPGKELEIRFFKVPFYKKKEMTGKNSSVMAATKMPQEIEKSTNVLSSNFENDFYTRWD